MKKMFSALAVMAMFVSSAQAIRISNASAADGVARVSGGNAAGNSTIKWEGGNVATARRNGGFSFFFGVVPTDCVGTLSDGVSTIEVALRNCTPTPAPAGGVLKTGQTDNFGVVGSDGDLQKGTARSYTDNGATVTDNVTGLEWEKLTRFDSSINDSVLHYTWVQAFQKIDALNSASFAGHTDWRLPNVNELRSLADYGKLSPSIDQVFNNGTDSFTEAWLYWSSTVSLDPSHFSSVAWRTDFRDGGVGIDLKGATYGVRAVRGGP